MNRKDRNILIGIVFAIIFVLGGGFASIKYSDYERSAPKVSVEYTFANGQTIRDWDPYDYSEPEYLALHPKETDKNMPSFWEVPYVPQGARTLYPSRITWVEEPYKKEIHQYYFSAEGKQYWVEKQENGLLRFGELVDMSEVLGFKFDSAEQVKSFSLNVPQEVQIYLIKGSTLVWYRKATGGPNDVYVSYGDKTAGPYAEVTHPFFFEGALVYVARKSEIITDGVRKQTDDSYSFVWNTRHIPVDCGVFVEKPAEPKPVEAGDDDAAQPVPKPAPQNFVTVVKPLEAPLCGKKVQVGLDRLVEKSLVNGREVTVETLYYSLDGKHFEIPAEKTELHIITPPNRNTSL